MLPRRLQLCGRIPLPGWRSHIDVMTRSVEGATRAHFHGVVRCGSWAACPVCSYMLRKERAAEVTRCVQWWRGQGGTVELLTLTFAHGMHDDLPSLNRAFQTLWRKLWAGMPGKRLRTRLGIVHFIRGTDHTHGRNGWHPHYHVVLFTRPEGGERQRVLALRDLRERWNRIVAAVLSTRHVPSWERGVDLRASERDEYIVKLGLELTSVATKTARRGGRTPWDIAHDAIAEQKGQAEREGSIELWDVYVAAMKGVRQLTWSRELRRAAALGKEKTDQEIVDGLDNAAVETHVASVPMALWRRISPSAAARYDLVVGAEEGGQIGVARALSRHLYGLAPPEPGEREDQLTLDLFAAIAPIAPEPRARADTPRHAT